MNDSSSANLFIPNADALMCGLVGSPTKSFYYTKGMNGITLKMVERVKRFMMLCYNIVIFE